MTALLFINCANAKAAHYELYSKARQCFGYYASTKEPFTVQLVLDIAGKRINKGKLIGTAVEFSVLKPKEKFKIALMCKARYDL